MTRAMVRDLWRCTSASFEAIAAIARKQTIPHLIQRFDVLCIPPQCGDHGEEARLPAVINLRSETQRASGNGDRCAAGDSRAVPLAEQIDYAVEVGESAGAVAIMIHDCPFV